MYYYFDYIVEKYNSYASNQFPIVDESIVKKQGTIYII